MWHNKTETGDFDTVVLVLSQNENDTLKLHCYVQLLIILLFESVSIKTRVEKDKVQYFSELNDMRASVDHLSNEKVRLLSTNH